jgi:dTDP-4-amino-4,6-dideoxygalactose transaminase
LSREIVFSKFGHSSAEIDAVVEVLRTGATAGGGAITKTVEEKLTDLHLGSPTLALSSCTHGLEMSMMLANVRAGDEVILPSFAFPSLANVILLRNATPRFVDVDPITLNIEASEVADSINERTKAIVFINYNGVGTELVQLRELADDRGLWLIEDNAHGLGGSYQSKTLGTFGHLSVTSFHQTKNISSGEGGAIVLNSRELRERAEVLRDKGTNRSEFLAGNVDKYSWQDLGSSWVLSDVLSALLISQLDRLPEILEQRRKMWSDYFEHLRDWADAHGVRMPPDPTEHSNTGHVFFLRFPSRAIRDRFIGYSKERKIVTPFHYQPLHKSRFGLQQGLGSATLPVSVQAGETLVRLPLHRDLSSEDVGRVIETVTGFN